MIVESELDIDFRNLPLNKHLNHWMSIFGSSFITLETTCVDVLSISFVAIITSSIFIYSSLYFDLVKTKKSVSPKVIYDEGLYFMLTMHPQIIGVPSRSKLLDRLIQQMKSKGDVWFATPKEITEYWLEHGGNG